MPGYQQLPLAHPCLGRRSANHSCELKAFLGATNRITCSKAPEVMSHLPPLARRVRASVQ